MRITKKSGFRGDKSAKWWTKDSKYGVRYQCSSCGKVTRGFFYGTREASMHYTDCPRILEARETDQGLAATPAPTSSGSITCAPRQGFNECSVCFVTDSTVQMLTFHWQNTNVGNAISVPLCLGCRRKTAQVLCEEVASADSLRETFEAGFAIGLERGHDTARVRAEVTPEMVSEDLVVRERALKDHMTGVAESVGRR